MKRLMIMCVLLVGLVAGAGYYLYRTWMPDIIADAVISGSGTAYIPKRLKARVEEIRAPINDGTGAIVEKMQAERIPIDEVIHAIDAVTEDQTNAFLDDVNRQKPKTTDEIFDLATKHFSTSFDPEVFRKPFTEHFSMEQIKDALAYANLNRKSKDVDLPMAKAIAKKIIIEKEREMR